VSSPNAPSPSGVDRPRPPRPSSGCSRPAMTALTVARGAGFRWPCWWAHLVVWCADDRGGVRCPRIFHWLRW